MSHTVTLRPACAGDAVAVHGLIAANMEVGHLLPRTIEDIERHAGRFIVADAGEIVGCAELAPLGSGVAEIRSLVVREDYRGQRIGVRLVEEVAAAATADGHSTLCAFTHEPSRFVRQGFTIVPHMWVPEKIAHDCTACALFRRCGQHAVTLALRPGVTVRPERPAAVIYGGRSVAPRRPNVERLHLRQVNDAAADAVAEPVTA
jgi:amino-acid N-acetyltransferase